MCARKSKGGAVGRIRGQGISNDRGERGRTYGVKIPIWHRLFYRTKFLACQRYRRQGSTLNSYLSVPLHRVNCQSRSSVGGAVFLRMHVRLHAGRDDQIRAVDNPRSVPHFRCFHPATRPRLEHAAKSSRLRTDRNASCSHGNQLTTLFAGFPLDPV